MNKKGNTPRSKESSEKSAFVMRLELKQAIMEMNDEEAVTLFRDLADKRVEHGGRELEEPVYPLEFLSAVQDHMFQSLIEYLEGSDAPREAVDLVEDLSCFVIWKKEVERREGGKVGFHVNSCLVDVVASATRHIAAIGGTFQSPYGETTRRRVTRA